MLDDASTEDEDYFAEYSDRSKLIRCALAATGVYPVSLSRNPVRRRDVFLHRARRFATLLVLATFVSLQFATMMVEDDWDLIFVVIRGILIILPTALKFLIIYFHTNDLEIILRCLEVEFWRGARTDCEREISRRHMEDCLKTTRMFLVIVGAIICSVICEPMIDMLLVDGNCHRRSLPFEYWLPWDVKNSSARVYSATYAGQVVFSVGAWTTVLPEVLVVYVIVGALAQFEIIQCRLGDLDDVAGGPTNRCLGEIVRHHQSVLRFSAQLKDTLSKIILVQFAMSVASFTTLAAYAEGGLRMLNSHASAAIMAMSQFFLYCNLATELTEKSRNVSKAAYCNWKWYEASAQMQRFVTIVDARSEQRPVQLTIGKMAAANLETFLTVMNFVASAFVMLRNVLAKKDDQ